MEADSDALRGGASSFAETNVLLPSMSVEGVSAMYGAMALGYEEMVAGDWSGDPAASGPNQEVCAAILRALELTREVRGPVIDCGCGPGFALAWLHGTGEVDLRGVDVSQEMVALTRTRCGSAVDVRVGDMQRLDSCGCPDGAARVLLNMCCIQHYDRAGVQATLAAARRTLAPGGALLLQFWSGREDGPMPGGGGPDEEGVFLQYSRPTIRDLTRAAGLAILEESLGNYIFGPGEPPMEFTCFILH